MTTNPQHHVSQALFANETPIRALLQLLDSNDALQ